MFAMKKKHEDKNENHRQNLENQLKRAVADYQNREKRIAMEKADWIRLSNKDLLLRLLPGLDSLILAQKHTQDEGVKIAIKHFLEILEQEGVKKIETEGKDFDPNLMEVVATREGDAGKVLEETRTGYALGDKVLRPAQVIVGGQEN